MKKIGRLVKTVETSCAYPRKGEGSFLRLKNGSIMLAFTRFGGAGEDHDSARLCFILSRDEGETWSEEKEFFDDDRESRNNMAAALYRMPNGEIGLSYFRKLTMPNGAIACMPVFRFSADEGKTWSPFVNCIDRPGYYTGTNAATIVTKAGRIVTPTGDAGQPVHRYDLEPGAVRFLCSDDCGRSWQESMRPIFSPYQDKTGFHEPGLLELDDGTLFCHMRTIYGFQYQSVSTDGGKNWTVPEPALLFPSPDAPMRLSRLNDLTVAVFNPVVHAYTGVERTPWGSPRRSPLMLAVSRDGGRSFVRRVKDFSYRDQQAFERDHCFLIEDDLNDSYCYPAMIRTENGLLVTYYCDNGSNRVLNCSRVTKITEEELGI